MPSSVLHSVLGVCPVASGLRGRKAVHTWGVQWPHQACLAVPRPRVHTGKAGIPVGILGCEQQRPLLVGLSGEERIGSSWGKTREPAVGNEYKSREEGTANVLPQGWSSEDAATGAIAAGHWSWAAGSATPGPTPLATQIHHNRCRRPLPRPRPHVPEGTSERLAKRMC